MELLKLAYAAVKATDPGAIVISGALTPTGAPAPWAMDDFAYLEGMYQNGLKNYCDGIGAHPSGYNMPPDADWSTFNDPTAALPRPVGQPAPLVELPRHHGRLPQHRRHVWRLGQDASGRPNSAGLPRPAGRPTTSTPPTTPSKKQAEWTVRAYQMGKAWGWVGPMFLWNLNFNVVAPGSEQAQWGIVDSGWGPLPIYSALAAMPK